MKKLILLVRLLDMLTGSGFYELTRYSNGKGLNLSTSKFMSWRHRTARRLWAHEALFAAIPFIVIGSILTALVPGVGAIGFGLTGSFMLTALVLLIFFPPLGLLLL